MDAPYPQQTLWDHVCSRLDDIFEGLSPPPPTITFTHSCDHFSCFYALNRFLVLVLLAYLEEKRAEFSGPRSHTGSNGTRIPASIPLKECITNVRAMLVPVTARIIRSFSTAASVWGELDRVRLRHPKESSTSLSYDMGVKWHFLPYH